VLEPKLSWAFVRTRSQQDNPLFIPQTEVPARVLRGLTLDNVTLDPADRIANANILRLGVENRFYVDAGSALVKNLRAEVELSVGYDFERGAFDSIILDGATNPRRGPRSRFTVALDPESWHVDEALLELSFSTPRIAGVGLLARGSYRYRRQVPRFYEDFASPLTSDDSRFQSFEQLNRVSQVDARLQIELGPRWNLTYRIIYSLDQSLMLVNAGGVRYRSKCGCWSVGFEVVDDRTREIRYLFGFNLLGLGDKGGDGLSLGSSL
jgi:lipopolysaccharide assembly outer membrane protein LptD (OstA)